MKKIEDSKYFIQIYDILYIQDQGIHPIPKTVWDKMMDDDLLDYMDDKTFIELNTNEEISFFESLNDTYLLNYLDTCSNEQIESMVLNLNDYLSNLRKKYDTEKCNMNALERKHIDTQIELTIYKLDSLNNYIKEKANNNTINKNIKA